MPSGPLIVAINKPVDKSTFYLVKKAKPHLGKDNGKIGHFGTLDPFANGLVLLGCRGAMRLMNYVHDESKKVYLAKGLVGHKTDTADSEGKIIAKNSEEEIATGLVQMKEELAAVMSSMKGKYLQVPPAYSATKFEGKALYEYAREGVTISKPAVEREIFKIDLIEISPPFVTFRCEVGTGTYIRTLFEDLCLKFGLFGHLTELRREAIGDISLNEALELETLSLELMEKKAISVERILKYPRLDISNVDSCRFLQGQSLRILEGHMAEDLFLVFFEQKFLGIVGGDGKPKVVFNQQFSHT